MFICKRQYSADKDQNHTYVTVMMDAPSAIVLGNFLTSMTPISNIQEGWKQSLSVLGDQIHANGTAALKDYLP